MKVKLEIVELRGPASAVAMGGEGGQGGRAPLRIACAPILVYSKYCFGASCDGKTTYNDVKRNNYVQT